MYTMTKKRAAGSLLLTAFLIFAAVSSIASSYASPAEADEISDDVLTGSAVTIDQNSTVLEDGRVGEYYEHQFKASGYISHDWDVSEQLPPGLRFNAGNIFGKPTTAGTYTFTVKCTGGLFDGSDETTSTLTILPAHPVITNTSLPYGRVNDNYSVQVQTKGEVISLSVTSGKLPNGMVFNGTTGVISGKPTEIGIYNFTVTATNSINETSSKEFTLEILSELSKAPVISEISLFPGKVNENYSVQFKAEGDGVISWSLTGKIPQSFTFSEDGILSGRPTADEVGVYSFTVEASNEGGVSENKQTLIIYPQTFSGNLRTEKADNYLSTVGKIVNDRYVDDLYDMNGDNLVDGRDMVLYLRNAAASDNVFYLVRFVMNGGNTIQPISVLSGTPVNISLLNPEKSGFRFDGFYIDQALTQKYDNAPITRNTTLYAKWSAVTYNVTFVMNGGNAIQSISVPSGNPVNVSSFNPEKSGFRFDGFYLDQALTQKYDNAPITRDTTLYAKWSAVITTYKVTFDSGGGTERPERFVDSGQTITQPENPKLAGYNFVGWYYGPSEEFEWDFKTDRVYSDMVLYAHYKPYGFYYNELLKTSETFKEFDGFYIDQDRLYLRYDIATIEGVTVNNLTQCVYSQQPSGTWTRTNTTEIEKSTTQSFENMNSLMDTTSISKGWERGNHVNIGVEGNNPFINILGGLKIKAEYGHEWKNSEDTTHGSTVTKSISESRSESTKYAEQHGESFTFQPDELQAEGLEYHWVTKANVLVSQVFVYDLNNKETYSYFDYRTSKLVDVLEYRYINDSSDFKVSMDTETLNDSEIKIFFNGSGTKADPYQVENADMFLLIPFSSGDPSSTQKTYYLITKDFEVNINTEQLNYIKNLSYVNINFNSKKVTPTGIFVPGSGKENDKYKISTAEQYLNIKTRVLGSKETVYYELCNNIVLPDSDEIPKENGSDFLTVSFGDTINKANITRNGYHVINQKQAINESNFYNKLYTTPTTESDTYYLCSDINMNKVGTPPVSIFNGTLDGCGYNITNMYIYQSATVLNVSGDNISSEEATFNGLVLTGYGKSIGLFGKNTGTIKNIVFKNPRFICPTQHNGSFVFIGTVCGNNTGTIENITVENINISCYRSGSSVGGIAGVSTGSNTSIINCTVRGGEICGTSRFGGGIVGVNANGSNITSCHVIGNGISDYYNVSKSDRFLSHVCVKHNFEQNDYLNKVSYEQSLELANMAVGERNINKNKFTYFLSKTPCIYVDGENLGSGSWGGIAGVNWYKSSINSSHVESMAVWSHFLGENNQRTGYIVGANFGNITGLHTVTNVAHRETGCSLEGSYKGCFKIQDGTIGVNVGMISDAEFRTFNLWN